MRAPNLCIGTAAFAGSGQRQNNGKSCRDEINSGEEMALGSGGTDLLPVAIVTCCNQIMDCIPEIRAASSD